MWRINNFLLLILLVGAIGFGGLSIAKKFLPEKVAATPEAPEKPAAPTKGEDPAKTRNEITMNTGLPLSDGLKAYDVEHYTLRHEIFPETKSIGGSATITFTALTDMEELELDFDGEYEISKVEGDAGLVFFRKTPAKLYVTLAKPLTEGETANVTVYYSGTPMIARRAPWEGGFVFDKTPSGKPWIATAIQFEGCDIWWPCKDHPTGEAKQGLEFFYTVPAGLSAAANGVLQEIIELDDGRRTFHWKTEVPTNVYGVALNVAPYVRFQSNYRSVNGTNIPLEFWAIEDHEEAARKLFDKEFPEALASLEGRFGPFPWGQEKMGVAETPHKGMEHQTINAYGNEFARGTFGYDDLLYHELAHEWFGNVMSVANTADMWLHEGGATYADFAHTREVMGDAAFHTQKYLRYLGIKSCQPVAPDMLLSGDETYHEGTGPQGDMYAKGAWVLYSLGYVIGEDKVDRALKRLIYDTPNPETLTPPIEARLRSTDDLLRLVSDEAGSDFGWFFDVYIRNAPLPELMTRKDGNDLVLKWKTANDLPFPMPVPVRVNGAMQRVEMPGGTARIAGGANADVMIDPMMEILRKLSSSPTCEERKVDEEKAKAKREAAAQKRKEEAAKG